jgi:hypothetical protein
MKCLHFSHSSRGGRTGNFGVGIRGCVLVREERLKRLIKSLRCIADSDIEGGIMIET